MDFKGMLKKLQDFLGIGLATTRTLSGGYLWFLRATGFVFAVYFLYGAVNGSQTLFGLQRWDLFHINFPFIPYYSARFSLTLFIFFTTVLTFMLYPARKSSPKDRPSAVDIGLCFISLAILIEYIYFYDYRGATAGNEPPWNDIVFGLTAAIIMVEMCRRVLGLVLPVVALVFLFYDWAGPWFPGLLAHKGAEFPYIMSFLYSQSGIYGIITSVYSEVVFIFLIFGSLLQATRVGDVFIDLAFALVGRYKGGAAKAAVVSSGLVGSIVGSGAANIVITGTFTIPLMKRGGFKPTFAAATEAVASIGGHLMPPIMASTAFIMAAMTETPYWHIALISLVPALLYYVSVFMSVHYYACRHNLKGLPKEQLPDFKKIFREDAILLVPVVILVTLLIFQFSPFFAGFWSIISAIVFYTIREKCWPLLGVQAATFVASAVYGGDMIYLYMLLGAAASYALKGKAREIFFRISGAFYQGSINSLVIGATAGVMGLVLTGVTHPDLAQKMTSIILSYSQGYIFLAVVLVAMASYILGMGMTITASYILIIILAGPALQELGLTMLTSHMIVLWLSQDAALTPPFALGAFIAAGIAQCDPMRTGFTSLKLAKPLYVVPLLMAYTSILMEDGISGDVILVWTGAALAFICSAAVLEGYFVRLLTIPDRLMLAVASLLLFWNGIWFKAAGLAVMVASYYIQRARPEDFVDSVSSYETTTSTAEALET